MHHATDKNGLRKIQMLVIYNRMKFTLATNYKVTTDQFIEGRCKGFKMANTFNANLLLQKERCEKLLLSVIETNPDKETLHKLFTGKEEAKPTFTTFCEYADEIMKRQTGLLSEGRLRHFKTLRNQVMDFGNIKLPDISPITAAAFEKYLRLENAAQNTLNSKMTIFITIVKHAITEKLIKPDCLFGYKKPPYIQNIPDYLTEEETKAFKGIVDATLATSVKTAGYYYLLACYTGYRISDLSKFKYDEAVKGNTILIRAKKNKKIVSMPIYPRLAEILAKVKELPFNITEQTMRKYVKELALHAGLGRKIKVHTARHTFAMMLIEKGFSIEKAAEFLGDTVDVARIYARVNPVALHKEVMEKLG